MKKCYAKIAVDPFFLQQLLNNLAQAYRKGIHLEHNVEEGTPHERRVCRDLVRTYDRANYMLITNVWREDHSPILLAYRDLHILMYWSFLGKMDGLVLPKGYVFEDLKRFSRTVVIEPRDVDGKPVVREVPMVPSIQSGISGGPDAERLLAALKSRIGDTNDESI
jgi:hypothetical protein